LFADNDNRQKRVLHHALACHYASENVALVAAVAVCIKDQVAQAVGNQPFLVALYRSPHMGVVPDHKCRPQVYRKTSQIPLVLSDATLPLLPPMERDHCHIRPPGQVGDGAAQDLCIQE